MPICSIAGDPMCTVDDSCKYCSGRLSGINSWCHSWPWLKLVQWHIHSSERNLPIHKQVNNSGLEMLWLVERATRINLGPWMLSGTCRLETFCFTWLVVMSVWGASHLPFSHIVSSASCHFVVSGSGAAMVKKTIPLLTNLGTFIPPPPFIN